MVRGELWWGMLPSPVGRRPVLVVQSDRFNRSRISTVVVSLVTSNVKRAASPGNVLLSRRESKLSRPAVVSVSQLFSVPRGTLIHKIAKLEEGTMRKVEEGLRLVLEDGSGIKIWTSDRM